MAPIYGKRWVERVRSMEEALDAAQGRIDRGAPPGPAARRVLRRFSNFHDGILDSAFTLRLDECLEVNSDLGRRSQRFVRNVKAICRPAARRFAKAIDQQSIAGIRTAHGEMKATLRRLRRRGAPQQLEQAWSAALRSAAAVEREVGSLSARAGTLTATEVEAIQRKLTALSKPARRRFVGLGFPACARLF